MTFNVILKPGSITWKQFYLICWLYRSAGSTHICYQDLLSIKKFQWIHWRYCLYTIQYFGVFTVLLTNLFGERIWLFSDFKTLIFFFKWLRHTFKILTPNLSPPLERTRRAPLATILWSTKPRASWSSAFPCHWTPSGEA